MLRSNLVFTLLFFLTFQSFANEAVKDNSFLIEEAYNQEPGVVQFINAWQYSNLTQSWSQTFTNEFPAPDESHQVSYSLPYLKDSGENDQPDKSGLGDVMLNYRYLMLSTETLTFTPRVSLILPTGVSEEGRGYGAFGYQFNQTLSININERFTNHWNAGFTIVPQAKDADGNTGTLSGFNFGSSAIYNLTPKTNILLEFVMNSMEEVTGPASKENKTTYFIVPGIRTAFNGGDQTEVVPGLGVLLGAGPSALEHETSVFAYLSIESKLW